MSFRAATTLAFVAATLALSARAGAESDGDEATARQLHVQGSAAMREGNWAQAAECFARAHALFPSAAAMLGEARALVRLGRLVEARARYAALVEAATPGSPPDDLARVLEEARVEFEALHPRIPSLIVEAAEGRAITIDGEPFPPDAVGVPWLVDPGRHVIVATGAHERFERVVVLREGGQARIVVDPPATDPPPIVAPPPSIETSGLEVAGWTLGALGLSSLIASAVTGGLWLRERAAVANACDSAHRCSPEGLEAVARGRALGVAQTVTMFTGIAALGAGIVMVVIADGDAAEPSLSLVLPPGELSIRGRF